MKEFLARFGSLVTGVLSGFDRLVFRGTLLPLMRDGGLSMFLRANGIRLLDFKEFATSTTEKLKEASLAEAVRLDRPVVYLDSSKTDKERLARKLLEQSPVKQGLICVFKVLETCQTFEYHRSPDPKARGYRLKNGKCLNLYKYYMHPQFGFMNSRIQTWFPFNIQVCLNGREWLAQQLLENHTASRRADNCFKWLGNPELAQQLMTSQLETDWPRELDRIARWLNPRHAAIFRAEPMSYYWTTYQMEWATDVLFEDSEALSTLYPALVRHAMLNLKSPDIMRFLGAGPQ